MQVKIPDFALVIIVGANTTIKTNFINEHFSHTEIVDCSDLALIEERLKNKQFTVVNQVDLQPKPFQILARLSKKYHCKLVAIVLNLGENESRNCANEAFHLISKQTHQIQNFVKNHKHNGIRTIYELTSTEEIETASLFKYKLWCNREHETGAFDIIGDVHGCGEELEQLLIKLDYEVETGENFPFGYQVIPPSGRKAFFVGDLTDRGPDSPKVLRIVMSMIKQKKALCVRGNHDDKVYRMLLGKKVKLVHGLAETAEQLDKEPIEFVEQVRDFLGKLVNHYVVDNGNLVVAHAGLREDMHGRASGKVNSFCLYGDTTGKKDEFGLVERLNWATDYRGKAFVVYGHTPQAEAVWENNTMNIDTGCVFGGWLTALRYPEREIVQVRAIEEYYEYRKPLYKNESMSK